MNSTENLLLNGRLTVDELSKFTFNRSAFLKINLDEKLQKKIHASAKAIQALIEQGGFRS